MHWVWWLGVWGCRRVSMYSYRGAWCMKCLVLGPEVCLLIRFVGCSRAGCLRAGCWRRARPSSSPLWSASRATRTTTRYGGVEILEKRLGAVLPLLPQVMREP